MKILLAGYNIDRDLIEQLKRGDAVDGAALTPETVSAAYARISRNPADVNVLREKARGEVEKARKSNEQIVFGLGHASVAEHACFNFDVIGVSRLAIEYLEHFRLASYTEKSQRYIKIEDDGLIPEEFSGEPLRGEFLALIQEQNEFYRHAYTGIKQTLIRNGEQPKEASLKAKEDARYALPLAIRGQLGMTVNGRTLENMIQKLQASPLAEVRELGRQLFACCASLVPSLVKYTVPDDYHLNAGKLPGNFPLISETDGKSGNQPAAVRLLSHSESPDDSILETLLFNKVPVSFDSGAVAVGEMTFEEKKSLFLELFRGINSYHSVNRVFENTDFTFEIVLSATAFAQLKRHRMGTLITQPYLPELGVTIPETMVASRVDAGYLDLTRRVNRIYHRFAEKDMFAAAYCLTNGHRRRVLFKLNAREMYHFVRLRGDEHAQWDIRAIAGEMLNLVRDVAPLTFMMACGKHEFKEIKDRVFPDE